MTHTLDRKTLRMLTAALLAVLLSGVAAGCVKEQGTYQGGGDSVPYHRR